MSTGSNCQTWGGGIYRWGAYDRSNVVTYDVLHVGVTLVCNIRITMGPTLEVTLGPCDVVGDGLYAVAALVHNVSMTAGTALVIYLVPPDDVGFGPGEGTQVRSNLVVNKYNMIGFYSSNTVCICSGAAVGRILYHAR